jgi:hypothetical protein
VVLDTGCTSLLSRNLTLTSRPCAQNSSSTPSVCAFAMNAFFPAAAAQITHVSSSACVGILQHTLYPAAVAAAAADVSTQRHPPEGETELRADACSSVGRAEVST